MRDSSVESGKARKWRRSVDHNMLSVPNSLLGSRYSSLASLDSIAIHRSTSMTSVRFRLDEEESSELPDIFKDDFASFEESDDDGVWPLRSAFDPL